MQCALLDDEGFHRADSRVPRGQAFGAPPIPGCPRQLHNVTGAWAGQPDNGGGGHDVECHAGGRGAVGDPTGQFRWRDGLHVENLDDLPEPRLSVGQHLLDQRPLGPGQHVRNPAVALEQLLQLPRHLVAVPPPKALELVQTKAERQVAIRQFALDGVEHFGHQERVLSGHRGRHLKRQTRLALGIDARLQRECPRPQPAQQPDCRVLPSGTEFTVDRGQNALSGRRRRRCHRQIDDHDGLPFGPDTVCGLVDGR